MKKMIKINLFMLLVHGVNISAGPAHGESTHENGMTDGFAAHAEAVHAATVTPISEAIVVQQTKPQEKSSQEKSSQETPSQATSLQETPSQAAPSRADKAPKTSNKTTLKVNPWNMFDFSDWYGKSDHHDVDDQDHEDIDDTQDNSHATAVDAPAALTDRQKEIEEFEA